MAGVESDRVRWMTRRGFLMTAGSVAAAGSLAYVIGRGMMGMGGMMGMSCTHVIHASTAGLTPGSAHTLIALLVDNLHVPLMPMVASEVKVRIGK